MTAEKPIIASNGRIDWSALFSQTPTCEVSGVASVTISKATPGNSRPIWKEDEQVIRRAASENGFELLSDNAKQVCFIKRLKQFFGYDPGGGEERAAVAIFEKRGDKIHVLGLKTMTPRPELPDEPLFGEVKDL